jgi:hypothetical protein
MKQIIDKFVTSEPVTKNIYNDTYSELFFFTHFVQIQIIRDLVKLVDTFYIVNMNFQ